MRANSAGLSALDAASASVSVDEVRVARDAVWWLESRPLEDGRVALMRMPFRGASGEFTPEGADVGSDLHGYGGAAFAVDGRRVWYIDRREGNLRLVDNQGDRPILRPRAGENFGDLAAADGRVWCISEYGSSDELLEVTSEGARRSLVVSDGFLGSPRPAPGRLAWLRWDSDRMPWDGAELAMGIRAGASVEDIRTVAGGREESVTQPWWDTAGRLWFVSDRTGWWNLYSWSTGESALPVALMSSDCAPPEWEAGYHTFVKRRDGSVVMIAFDGPVHSLYLRDGGSLRKIPVPYTSFKPYLATDGRQVYAIAASPNQPPRIVAIDPDDPSASAAVAGPPRVTSKLSTPELMHISAGAGKITALLYPANDGAVGSPSPLVVRAHPGPTSSTTTRLDWSVQYLTSHGIAVADLDYRGSSGYGRAFRRSLYGQWGTSDVEDCIAVAEFLANHRRALPGQVFIMGASAGGYTALQAVSRSSIFAGAVARSAIIDPRRWQRTAPRWQQPHAAALAGPAGQVRAERIRKPVLFVHGTDDHVAPLADVMEVSERLIARERPGRLFVIDARHQLSAQEATARAFEAELEFYQQLIAGFSGIVT